MGYFCYPKKGIYMCGIAGQFNYNNENNDIYKDVLEIMQQTMNRRGPDQNGIYMGTPAVVGRSGIKQRIYINLTEEETKKLQNSVDIIKSAVESQED